MSNLKLALVRVRADHWQEMDAVAASKGLGKNAYLRLLIANAVRSARSGGASLVAGKARKSRRAKA
jgi:hypothetical protein